MALTNETIVSLPKPKYQYITTEDEARRALNEIAKYPRIPVDTETTALDPYEAKITLVQIGIPNFAYVFDVRHDTEHSEVNIKLLDGVLTNKNVKKIFQNATFDMKLLKLALGHYIENIYDTMLVEQLLNLGISVRGSRLNQLVLKYLGLTMSKEPAGTFEDYNQKFKPYQLEYAANDVMVMTELMDAQTNFIKHHKLEDVSRLEFEFTVPMCEMELNGIAIDTVSWQDMMQDVENERDTLKHEIASFLSTKEDQITLFGKTLINLDSPIQLKKSLNKFGVNLPDTSVGSLQKYSGVKVISQLLEYRKAQKLVTTYGQALLDRINPTTGRLHTNFRQMVSTGRMSSAKPNLQNIPKKQKYRSGFTAKNEDYVLITADMSGAELRILGNVSQDPIFIECYANGIDLHTRTAKEVFGDSSRRGDAKAINFGLCYGLTKYGLSARLGISEKEADNMINTYFDRYKGVKTYLDKAGREGVRKRYTRTISGRKRFYNLPPYSHPEYKKQARAVERKAKNAGIQGANADTIKQSMVYLVQRLVAGGYDAKLVLTVHDEVVVECHKDQRYEVAKVVSQSLVDGFGHYFDLIPMETDALIGPCWLKSSCEDKASGKKCGGSEMKFIIENGKKKLVCGTCGAAQ